MRIILGRDYYDGAGFGVDPELIFVRREREVDPSGLPHGLGQWWGGDTSRILVGARGLAVVAGRAFPWMRLPADPDAIEDDPRSTEWLAPLCACARPDAAFTVLHGVDEASALVERLADRWACGRIRHEVKFGRRYLKRTIERHFAPRDPDAVMRWAVANAATTAIVTEDATRRRVSARADGAFLHEAALWRVLPPSEAHQMIAGFIGGVLPRPDRPTAAITDRDRVVKAGFDPQWSFRRPGREKPRRETSSERG